jgi:putative Mg2+ transporter-C (MgtC) family protein
MVDVVLKLVLALVLGGIVGWEREAGRKPAGLRTNILICLGSAMMMAMSDLLLGSSPVGSADSLRIAAGVITGMGFIGAGTIIQAHGHIHGLTTASTLWAVAGLGLVVGAGLYAVAAVYTAVLVVILSAFPRLERRITRRSVFQYRIKVPSIASVDDLRREAETARLKLEELAFLKTAGESFLSFHLETSVARARAFREKIQSVGEIVEVRTA